MSPELMSSEQHYTFETIEGTKAEFAELVEQIQVPEELVQTLREVVLPGTEVELSEGEDSCFFRDIGYLENGEPDGRYQITITKKVLDSRVNRIREVVPEADASRLGLIWITAHELGHALEAAYAYKTKSVTQDGVFKGLPQIKNPANEWVQKFPEMKAAPNIIDADRIERERWAEGFAQEMIVRELHKLGLDNHRIIGAVHELYKNAAARAAALGPLLDKTDESTALAAVYDGRIDDILGEKLDPQFVKHHLGYGAPMPVDEIARRYQSVY